MAKEDEKDLPERGQTDERKKQEMIFRLQVFDQQIQQMNQQLQAIEQAIVDLEQLMLGLDELRDSKDKEILAPLGKGIFVKTKLLTEDLTVDVGGKNFVNKTIPETKKILEEQIKKLENVKKDLNDNLENLTKELTKIFKEVQN